MPDEPWDETRNFSTIVLCCMSAIDKFFAMLESATAQLSILSDPGANPDKKISETIDACLSIGVFYEENKGFKPPSPGTKEKGIRLLTDLRVTLAAASKLPFPEAEKKHVKDAYKFCDFLETNFKNTLFESPPPLVGEPITVANLASNPFAKLEIDNTEDDKETSSLKSSSSAMGDFIRVNKVTRKQKKKMQDITSSILSADTNVLQMHDSSPFPNKQTSLKYVYLPPSKEPLINGNKATGADRKTKANLIEWKVVEEGRFLPINDISPQFARTLEGKGYVTKGFANSLSNKSLQTSVFTGGSIGETQAFEQHKDDPEALNELDISVCYYYTSKCVNNFLKCGFAHKIPVVERLFSYLKDMPSILERRFAAEKMCQFLSKDVAKNDKTAVNKGIYGVTAGLLANWKKGETKVAMIERCTKSVDAMWGNQAKLYITEFNKISKEENRPAKQRSLLDTLNFISANPRPIKPVVEKVKTSFADAVKSTVDKAKNLIYTKSENNSPRKSFAYRVKVKSGIIAKAFHAIGNTFKKFMSLFKKGDKSDFEQLNSKTFKHHNFWCLYGRTCKAKVGDEDLPRLYCALNNTSLRLYRRDQKAKEDVNTSSSVDQDIKLSQNIDDHIINISPEKTQPTIGGPSRPPSPPKST